MKRILLITVLAGFAPLMQAAVQVSADISANLAIPDGDPSGVASTYNLSALGNQITSVSVTLNISGAYNGDLYAYLTHGSGFAVLLNRVGVSPSDSLGYGDPGMNITLADNAANGNIHTYQQVIPGALSSPLSGTWSPDGLNISPLAVTGTETRTALLSSFDGIDPNGDWTLFVADVNGGDMSTLMSWGLNVAVIPEPTVFGMFAGTGLLALLVGKRRSL